MKFQVSIRHTSCEARKQPVPQSLSAHRSTWFKPSDFFVLDKPQEIPATFIGKRNDRRKIDREVEDHSEDSVSALVESDRFAVGGLQDKLPTAGAIL